MVDKVKSPLALVKEKFEKKEKLVDQLIGSLKSRDGESKDAFKKRLLKTSNAKLLKLNSKIEKK